MIVESGHTNCAMSHPEVKELRKSVLPCHLLSAYNRYILSATQLTTYLKKYVLSHHLLIASTSNVKIFNLIRVC